MEANGGQVPKKHEHQIPISNSWLGQKFTLAKFEQNNLINISSIDILK